MIYQACGLDKKSSFRRTRIFWPARKDSNLRPSESESDALSSCATGRDVSLLILSFFYVFVKGRKMKGQRNLHSLSFLSRSYCLLTLSFLSILSSVFFAKSRPPIPKAIANATASALRVIINAQFTITVANSSWLRIIKVATV